VDRVKLRSWFFVDEGRPLSFTGAMPRRPRILFEGAIYHVMPQGNGRQRIVHDDRDRERLLEDLRRAVLRCGWELLAFVFKENHLHLLLKTPRPNLAHGTMGTSLIKNSMMSNFQRRWITDRRAT
jgi:REP element-mobilizing transposase RayT